MAFDSGDKYEFIISAQDFATKELAKVKNNLKDIDKQVIKSAKSIAKWSAAIGGASVFVGNKLADMASDAGESMNAVNVVFGEASDNIVEFSRTAAREVGLSAHEFRQLSTETGTLLKATGAPMEDVTDQTIELTKRAADLASVFNTDVELAMSAVNQAIRGETEAIRKFGADVTDNTIKQHLLASGINKSVAELSQQEKTALRTKLILEQTAQVTGDFKNTIDGAANSQRVLTAKMKDYGAELGEKVLPIKIALIKTALRVVDSMGEVAETVKSVINWFKEHEHITKGLSAALGTTLVVALGLLAKAIIATVIPALVSMATAFAPFLIGGAVIAGVVAGVSYLRENWDAIWTAMKEIIFGFVEDIKNAILGLVNWLKEKIDSIFEKLKAAKDAVANLGGKAAEAVGKKVLDTRDAIKNAVGFANGGVFNGFNAAGIVQAGRPILGIAGEGKMNEAIVPLPNGRAIPVEMRGGAPNLTFNFQAFSGSREDAQSITDKVETIVVRALQKTRFGSQ